MQSRRILLVNDDGWFAPGLRAVALSLVAAGCDLRIVAPNKEQSGVGHGITIFKEIRCVPVRLEGDLLDKVPAYGIDGTPADCVKIAVALFPDFAPELVISGCNKGANVGISVHPSGTCAAAREAALNGMCSMALSLHCNHLKPAQLEDFTPGVQAVMPVMEMLLEKGLPAYTFLNVNLPMKLRGDVHQFKFTTHGMGGYDDHYQEQNGNSSGSSGGAEGEKEAEEEKAATTTATAITTISTIDGAGSVVGPARVFQLHGELRGHDDNGTDDMCELTKGWVTVSLLTVLSSCAASEVQNWPLFEAV